VPFDGPGTDCFSTRLLHLVKGNEFSCGLDSCFLFELSLRRIEWIFLFPVFTFGYRPCAGVLIFPKGSSRMDEEYLSWAFLLLNISSPALLFPISIRGALT